jgi:DNA primase
MGRFGDDKIEEVRSRADIVEVIGAHVRLKRVGRNFTGLCPFHTEKTPSFSVNRERGFFHCFGCGAGGTVFNFLMRMDGLTFPEAVRSLAQRYGVELPERAEPGMERGERESLQRANQVAAEFFSHVLWNTEDGAAAREYLKSRAITTETARAFMLGYAPSRPGSLARALERRGLRDAGIRLGLIRGDSEGLRDLFRARVMFPIRDAQGRVTGFGARVLDDRLPKYLNSPESPLYSKTRTLYGLYEARQEIARRDRAILVEGYFDAIALWQAGFKETVAGCGTALTVEQLRVLARYTRNVIACFDGDDAGRRASLRALEIFLEAGLLGRGIFIPAGYDPDTLVRERGADAFRTLADGAELLIDYFLREQVKEAHQSLDARARAAERVAAMLKLVANQFEFDLLVRKAASELGVSEELLRREGRARGRPVRGGGAQPAPAAGRAAVEVDAGAKAEVGLVAIALLHPALREELAAAHVEVGFDDRELAAAFVEVSGSEQPPGVLSGWLSERLSARNQDRLSAVAISSAIDDPAHARALARDYLAALERRRSRREVDALKRNIATAEEAQEVVTLAAARDRRQRSRMEPT